MKSFRIVFALVAMFVLSAFSIPVKAELVDDVLDVFVTAFQQPDINQSLADNGISDFTVSRKGHDIVMTFQMEDPEIQLSELSDSEKESVSEYIAGGFTDQMMSGADEDTKLVVMLLASNNVRFVFRFYDQYGDCFEKIIETRNLVN